MSKSKLSAVFGLILVAGFSISLVQARGDICQQVRDEQDLYLETQAQLEEELYTIVNEGSESVDRVYSQLMRYLGKSLGDISHEAQAVQFFAAVISEKGDMAFDQADLDDEKAYEWLEHYPECGWASEVEALEAWQLVNYENLETVGSFLSGYANMMNKWPSQWEELQRSGETIDEESFSQVDEVRKGLEESIELMSDTFEYTKEAFMRARPQ